MQTTKEVKMLFKCIRRPVKKYCGSLVPLYVFIEAETASAAKRQAEKTEHMKLWAGQYTAIVTEKYIAPEHGDYGYL